MLKGAAAAQVPAPTPPPLPAAKGAAALAFGDFVLDIAAQRLTRQGQPVALAPRYFAVLQHLAASGGRLVDKNELLDAVWGHRHVSDSVLKVAMNALRKVLGDDPKAPRYIETVARKGYRFLGAPSMPAGTAASSRFAKMPGLALPALGNLPAAQPGLIGRERDEQRLLQALAQHRLVTLHGPGGVGKTRLALAVAAVAPAAEGSRTANGVWLLRLDAMADAAPLLPGLAQMLSLGAGAGAEPAALARALGDLELLLVLDNAEHIADAVAALATAVLGLAPGVRMLVTSQVSLRVAGEQVLPLAPLTPPADGDPRAAESAALRLLLSRVRLQQPEATLSPAALADAAAICRALDGLPLALELAAARVPLLGWAGVRARLMAQQDITLGLLNRGQPGAAERQRTLQGALTWACALLSPAQQRVLQCLSLFAGSFSIEAAAAVAAKEGDIDAVIDHLDALREHALLVRVEAGDGPPRWRLFDSVRSFAAQGLAAAGEHESALQRLLEHLTAQFWRAVPWYFDMPLHDWLAVLEPDTATLRRALQLALNAPALQAQGVALFAASTLFRVRGSWRADALRDLRVLQALPPLALRPQVASDLDLALSVLSAHAQLLPPDQGLQAARRTQAHFKACGDVERETLALYMEGSCLIRLVASPAERWAAIARMQAIEPSAWTAMRRRLRTWMTTSLLRDVGDLAGHEAGCKAQIALGHAVGDPSLVWMASQSLAQTLFAQGQEDACMALLGHTVDGMRAAGQLRANAPVLSQWAAARAAQDAAPQTLSALREAAMLLQAESRLWWMADALAWPLAWRGQWDDAARVQGWADTLVRRRGDQRGPLFGRLRQRFGDWLDAQPQAEALRALLAAESDWDEAMVLSLVFERSPQP